MMSFYSRHNGHGNLSEVIIGSNKTRVPVTKQCRLVLAERRCCSVASNVTVGLASDMAVSHTIVFFYTTSRLESLRQVNEHLAYGHFCPQRLKSPLFFFIFFKDLESS